ncbi:MAG TPA: hypothetical protein VNP03_16925 [Pseudonocardia sp.]|nr:hypothetical protein [Pseudonocardia sp.]
MGPTRLPWVAAVVIAVLLGGVWLMVAGPAREPSSAWTADRGAVLSPADRDALAPAPVVQGAEPAGPDPSVDLTDPRAVATAYVVAAYSLSPGDAGRTNRRATPYAAPSTPPNTVGVLVLTPPPAGHSTGAAVTDVTQVSGEPTDTRRGYLVGYRTSEDPDPAGVPGDRTTRYLLLVRQFDGRWLVAGDTADAQVGEP